MDGKTITYWEDFEPGKTVTFGRYEVKKEEVLAFAREFDAQPFHLDEEIAKQSVFGGLAASGWHSCAMFMRMVYDEILRPAASLGSPGLEECCWLRPVFPGDTLSGRFTCRDKRVSKSMPGVGLVNAHYELINQHGEVVLTWQVTHRCDVRFAWRLQRRS